MHSSASAGEDTMCHAKDCQQTAAVACDRCGQMFCAEHVRKVTIKRRAEREDSRRLPLESLPLRDETYTLCRPCGMKPILGKRPAIS